MKKPTDNAHCSRKLKLLADATRLAILRRLRAGPLHVSEIGAGMAVEQSLLSHHLRVLRDAGLVRARRDGKAVLYALDDSVSPVGADGDSFDLGCCRLDFGGGY